ncbi:hypothetical protein TNCV_2058601 [Trichonephila clavipes]|nr:hypothetical protein TNCV_2058601 [Trichonephila clavipes]
MYSRRQTNDLGNNSQGLPPNVCGSRVFITPVIRPPVFIARLSTCLGHPSTQSIPEPPCAGSVATPRRSTTQLPELMTPLVQDSRSTCADINFSDDTTCADSRSTT